MCHWFYGCGYAACWLQDWHKTMTLKEQETITDLEKCDFKRMHLYFTQCSEDRKNRSKDEKLVRSIIYVNVSMSCLSIDTYRESAGRALALLVVRRILNRIDEKVLSMLSLYLCLVFLLTTPVFVVVFIEATRLLLVFCDTVSTVPIS